MFPQLSDDERLVGLALMLALIFLMFGFGRWLNRSAKKWLEENDRAEEPRPDDALGWLLGRLPQNPHPATLRYSEQEFHEIVSKVLDELPEEFDQELKNVAVIVSTEWPTDVGKKRMGVQEDHVVFGTYSRV